MVDPPLPSPQGRHRHRRDHRPNAIHLSAGLDLPGEQTSETLRRKVVRGVLRRQHPLPKRRLVGTEADDRLRGRSRRAGPAGRPPLARADRSAAAMAPPVGLVGTPRRGAGQGVAAAEPILLDRGEGPPRELAKAGRGRPEQADGGCQRRPCRREPPRSRRASSSLGGHAPHWRRPPASRRPIGSISRGIAAAVRRRPSCGARSAGCRRGGSSRPPPECPRGRGSRSGSRGRSDGSRRPRSPGAA